MQRDRCTVCNRRILPVLRAVQRTYPNACEACGRPLRPHDLIEKAVDRPPEVR